MRALKERGLYFTKHRKDIIGKPDIVFKRKKVAIFIDSAFWHGHANIPKANHDYWVKKLARNRQHDENVSTTLVEHGWTVLRLGEKEIKKELENCIKKILTAIGKQMRYEV